jgi:hypothetical protein
MKYFKVALNELSPFNWSIYQSFPQVVWQQHIGITLMGYIMVENTGTLWSIHSPKASLGSPQSWTAINHETTQ